MVVLSLPPPISPEFRQKVGFEGLLRVFCFYLHLDIGDQALVSQVQGVGYVNHWCPSKGKQRPLDVCGRSECCHSLCYLLLCLMKKIMTEEWFHLKCVHLAGWSVAVEQKSLFWLDWNISCNQVRTNVGLYTTIVTSGCTVGCMNRQSSQVLGLFIL